MKSQLEDDSGSTQKGDMSDEGTDEEVTRCICGNTDLVTDESDYEDVGLFVQCDNCLVWQHGYCVGLLDNSQMPETYHCELCRPDLHKIIQRPRRRKRSRYLGLDTGATGASGADAKAETGAVIGEGASSAQGPTSSTLSSAGTDKPSSSGTAGSSSKRDGTPPLPLPSHLTRNSTADEEESASVRRRRNTLNSRDAAYDRQLEAALLLSAQQSGQATTGSNGRSGRGKQRASPSITSKRTRTPSPPAARDSDAGSKTKRRKKGTREAASLKREETTESSTSISRRGGNGKNGTAALRKGSSRAKDLMQEEQEAESKDELGSTTSEGGVQARGRGALSQQNGTSQPGSTQASREGTPAAQITTEMAAPTSRKRDRRGGGNKKASDRHAAVSMMTGSSTRSSSSGGHALTASSMVGIGGNLIGANGRQVQFGEMRKRVSAILEYIGRCQVEMAAEKDDWVRWRQDEVDKAEEASNQEADCGKLGKAKTNGKHNFDEVWSYGEGSGGSVELMEKLTNTLLQWESQYGA